MNIIEDKNTFFDMVERERARADRMGHQFSIIVFQLRDLKRHALGREAILCRIRSRIRLYDDIGCLDNSRISVLMPYAGYEQAKGIAEKIRSAAMPDGMPLEYSVLTYPSSWVDSSDERRGSCTDSWAAASRLLREKLDVPVETLPFWKRLMDIAGACFGIALLSPLLLLLACFIRAVSPGPVLFKQERIGFMGKPFSCYKFRTMHLGAPTDAHNNHLSSLIETDAPLQKLDAADPRIIPCGRMIRLTGLDELPQLFNVLLGDMSLIGPRPCISYEAGKLKLWQRRRFDVMPGITGLWQVNGKNKTTFTEMIRYDISYAYKRNFFMDTAILLKTLPAVMAQVADGRKQREGVSNGKYA
ncbi:MAG: sugar transferase [Deltaproteobacteria bacterium]|nr:sugar transferase [Deltaproteobacteria bacterium]